MSACCLSREHCYAPRRVWLVWFAQGLSGCEHSGARGKACLSLPVMLFLVGLFPGVAILGCTAVVNNLNYL